jgi:hypothetical protein
MKGLELDAGGHAMEKIRGTDRSWFPIVEFPGAAFAAGKEAESWRKAQGPYLVAWNDFAERWSKHRLQDLQSTIELAVRPWGSLDPKELAEMQQKWMAGIVDRYMLDALAFAENAISLPLGDIVPPASARASAVKPVAGDPATAQHRAKRHESEVA